MTATKIAHATSTDGVADGPSRERPPAPAGATSSQSSSLAAVVQPGSAGDVPGREGPRPGHDLDACANCAGVIDDSHVVELYPEGRDVVCDACCPQCLNVTDNGTSHSDAAGRGVSSARETETRPSTCADDESETGTERIRSITKTTTTRRCSAEPSTP